MQWIILAPFSKSTTPGWIPGRIQSDEHCFQVIPATYDHDRSRKGTSFFQWLDYFYHALRGWLVHYQWDRGKSGFITSFPHLAVCVGVLKRLTGSRAPILAWSFNMGSIFGGAKGVLAKLALHSVDLFVVHSRAEIKLYSDWLALPPERFVFVPLSIEIEEESLPERDVEPFVLALGTANRDYKTLLLALEPLKYPTIIVSGPHAVATLHVPDYVKLKSGLSIDECHKLSQNATVDVIPIKDVDAPSGQVTLLETMMFRKAVIATRCAGTQDYIEHRVTGILVPPHDVAALRAAIDELWRDGKLRASIGEAARNFVIEAATFSAGAREMLKLLNRLVRGSDLAL